MGTKEIGTYTGQDPATVRRQAHKLKDLNYLQILMKPSPHLNHIQGFEMALSPKGGRLRWAANKTIGSEGARVTVTKALSPDDTQLQALTKLVSKLQKEVTNLKGKRPKSKKKKTLKS